MDTGKINDLEALADRLTSQLSASVNDGITYDCKPELAAIHEAINALRDLAAAFKAVDALRETPIKRELLVSFADSEAEEWAQ